MIATTTALLAVASASLRTAIGLAGAAPPTPASPAHDAGGKPNSASRRPPVADANALALDRAGRIVVAGAISAHFAVARYRPDGRLDTSFGEGGVVTTDFGANGLQSVANAVTIDPAGRIVAVGDNDVSLLVARYEPDGSLDRSFGHAGTVTTYIGGAGGDASAVTIDPPGRIVVAGLECDTTNCAEASFALTRFNPDGSLDPGFGDGGKVTSFGPDGGATAVAIDAQGRIVAAGGGPGAFFGSADFLVGRYNPDGSLDGTFGAGGLVFTAFDAGSASASAVSIDSAGRIVAAGTAGPDFALARYRSDGSLDPSFGDGGKATTGFAYPVGATDAALDAAGNIVAVGFGGGAFALARYSQSGSLDPTFGSGGSLSTDFPPGAAAAHAVAIDSAGRILAGGDRGFKGTATREFSLARYLQNGGLDPSFGQGGRVTTSFVPNTTIAKSKLEPKKRKARFTFKAIGQSRGFQCALAPDRRGSPRFTSCRSPKTYERLKPRRYAFEVRAVGAAGPDPSPAKRRFRIRAAPRTRMTKAMIVARGGRARFAFRSIGKASGFQCRLARRHRSRQSRFRRCRSPKAYRHLSRGRYTFAVRAVGPGGRDPSPAKRSFRVR